MSQTVKTLFWISTTNFVFPFILSLTQLIIYLVKPDEYLTALYVEAVNYHLTVIGVVFATVWAAEVRWELIQSERLAQPPSSSDPLERQLRLRKEGHGGGFSATPLEISVCQSKEVYRAQSIGVSESSGNNLPKVTEETPDYELLERSVEIHSAWGLSSGARDETLT